MSIILVYAINLVMIEMEMKNITFWYWIENGFVPSNRLEKFGSGEIILVEDYLNLLSDSYGKIQYWLWSSHTCTECFDPITSLRRAFINYKLNRERFGLAILRYTTWIRVRDVSVFLYNNIV